MNSEQVRCEFENKILTVFLSGEIDHHSASDVREEIDRNIFFYRPERLVLDLSNIDFMDSSGLGLILGRFTRMKDMGGEMCVSNPSEEIMKILKLAGVDKLFGLNSKKQKETAGYRFTKVKKERRELKK